MLSSGYLLLVSEILDLVGEYKLETCRRSQIPEEKKVGKLQWSFHDSQSRSSPLLWEQDELIKVCLSPRPCKVTLLLHMSSQDDSCWPSLVYYVS